jgi:peptidoglycan/LPS O-acetylase OafA/YrhL
VRAVAVIAVILFHLDRRLVPGGFSGVDVFFVISGFIVSASLHDKTFANPFRFWVYFLGRRTKRIFPALATVLLTTSLVTTLFIPRAYLSDFIPETGLAAFFGYSNIVLAEDANSYFSPRAEFNPFTHTWSLGVEEQFYLVFPVLFGLIAVRRKNLLLGATIVLAIATLSLVYGARFTAIHSTSTFYLIFGRFWELAAGMLTYVLLFKVRPTFKVEHERVAFTFIGVLLIAWSFVSSQASEYPFPGALVPVVGTVLLIVGLHARTPTSPHGKLLSNDAVVYIGLLSYSLYLWHWPVFVLFRWTCGLETIEQMTLALIVATSCALGGYYFVETPLRENTWVRAPAIALTTSLAILLGCAYLAELTFFNQESLSQSVVSKAQADWYPGYPPQSATPSCTVQVERSQVGIGSSTSITRRGCPETKSPMPTVFVVGDSHAETYLTLLEGYVLETGDRVISYENAGCPFLAFHPVENTQKCKEAAEAVLEDIEVRHHVGDILFLPSLRLLRFRDQWEGQRHDAEAVFASHEWARYRADGLNAAEKTTRELTKSGLKVIFELPKPIFEVPLFRCSDWFNKNNPICANGTSMLRVRLEAYRRPIVEAIATLQAKVSNVYSWDPFDVLCPPSVSRCEMFVGGNPLYFDADHISGFANRLLLPSFMQKILDVRATQGT